MARAGARSRGAVLVESTLSVMILVLIVLSGVELARYAYLAATTQFVVSRAARNAAVRVNLAAQRELTSAEALQEIKNDVVATGASFGLSINPDSQLTVCVPERDPLCRTSSAGMAGDYLVLRLSYNVNFLSVFRLGAVKASAVARREPSLLN